jgi:Ribosomal protein L11 methyltransferase (PrmA)
VAERIARALEETFDPSPVAVGAFELGKGRFEVFAHFAEAPPRDALLALIEHAADAAPHVALRIEQVADEDWVTLSQGKRIAAVKALKCPALATDNDRLAVDTARDNVRKNGVASLVRVLKATSFACEKLRSAAPDLVLANLLERALYELAPAFARYIPPHGRAILSGLTSDQARGIEARYAAHGFILEKRIILDGWTTLIMVRRNNRALCD